MKIIQERLERESEVSVVQTAPTVTFETELRDGTVQHVSWYGPLLIPADTSSSNGEFLERSVGYV